MVRSTASLHRVPWGGFPDFRSTISGLRSSPSIPPRFVAFAQRYLPLPLFAPRAGAAPEAWTTSTAAPAPPTESGENEIPWGIAADEAGDVFVADSLNNRLQVFDEFGNFVTQIGVAGAGEVISTALARHGL